MAHAAASAPHPAEWTIDSGASFHMTGDKRFFTNLRRTKSKWVQSVERNGETTAKESKYKGDIELQVNFTNKDGKPITKSIKIRNVRYVPDYDAYLLSTHQLFVQGYNVNYSKDVATVEDKYKNTVITANVENGTYNFSALPPVSPRAYLVAQSKDTEDNWHRRLGHINFGHLRQMLKHGTATGIQVTKKRDREDQHCEECQVGKIKRAKIPKEATRSQEERDTIGHVDVVGPLKPASIHGNKYIFFHTYKNFVEVYFGKTKDKAKTYLKHWVERIERQHGQAALQVLRSDNGGEYQNADLVKYLTDKGIRLEYTIARTPHQNGLAERKHQTVIDMVRTMFEDADVPDSLWEYAVSYAVYILNRCFTRGLPDGKSAYEHRYSKVPDLSHVRKFGERCVYKLQLRTRKLGRKGRRARFIGFDPQRKAYLVWDVEKKRVVNTRDLVLTRQPSQSGEVEAEEVEIDDEEVANYNAADGPTKTRRSLRLQKKNISHAYMVLVEKIKEPMTVNEALEGPYKQQWEDALKLEIQSLNNNGTWQRVRKPPGANVIKCRWVFKVKYNSDGVLDKFKARLVAKGFKQKFMVDYFETYAPVASKESFRVFLSIVAKKNLKMQQYDVPSAYVQANLQEEIYIEMPEKFSGGKNDLGQPTGDACSDGRPDDVLRLVKGLYGLKQAGRAWYKEVTQTLKKIGLTPTLSDPCVFTCFDGDRMLILLLYVDDIIIAHNWEEKNEEVVNELKRAYNVKELGEVKHFLGMKIQRRGDGILVSQEHFVRELLRRFNIEDVPPRHTPLDAQEMFMESSSTDAEGVPYRQIVGALLYVSTCSRPDISFAVGQAAKFASKPKLEHWEQLKKILGYLKATARYGLWFKSNDQDLEVYSDADWANDTDSRKSISGVLIKSWGCTVSWLSKKQTIVATSTKAAETIAACTALQRADQVKELLQEFRMKSTNGIVVQVDNKPAIQAIQNEKPAAATKHLSIRYHFIKERVQDGDVDLVYVESKNQLADLFTKSLPRPQFERLRKAIKIVPIHEE